MKGTLQWKRDDWPQSSRLVASPQSTPQEQCAPQWANATANRSQLHTPFSLTELPPPSTSAVLPPSPTRRQPKAPLLSKPVVHNDDRSADFALAVLLHLRQDAWLQQWQTADRSEWYQSPFWPQAYRQHCNKQCRRHETRLSLHPSSNCNKLFGKVKSIPSVADVRALCAPRRRRQYIRGRSVLPARAADHHSHELCVGGDADSIVIVHSPGPQVTPLLNQY